MKCKIVILEDVNKDENKSENYKEIFVQVKDLEGDDVQRIIKAVNKIEDIKK